MRYLHFKGSSSMALLLWPAKRFWYQYTIFLFDSGRYASTISIYQEVQSASNLSQIWLLNPPLSVYIQVPTDRDSKNTWWDLVAPMTWHCCAYLLHTTWHLEASRLIPYAADNSYVDFIFHISQSLQYCTTLWFDLDLDVRVFASNNSKC